MPARLTDSGREVVPLALLTSDSGERDFRLVWLHDEHNMCKILISSLFYLNFYL